MIKGNICLQLYSLRDYIRDIKGLKRTLSEIKTIGYDGIELAGLENFPRDEVKETLLDSQLQIPAMHIPWIQFIKDIDSVISDMKSYQCKNAVIPGVFTSEYRNEAGVKSFADDVIHVSDILKDEGITLSYHNHNHELCNYKNKSWLELLYSYVPEDKLKAELDVYWLQAGGASPVAWIKKYSNRQILIHLKDFIVEQHRLDDEALVTRLQLGVGAEQRVTEIGNGNMDIKSILNEAEKANVSWFVVEQDEAYGKSPLEAVKISYQNLIEIDSTR